MPDSGEAAGMEHGAAAGLKTEVRLAADKLQDTLALLKQIFVDKDIIIDLLGVCLAGGENLFLLGPPGTAKSAIVHQMGRLLQGRTFDYLLTSFSEPNELFGPFDIRRLREGDLVTNTEGMLPEADLVFLDELLNANSAILNSLLAALNERVFRRGREKRQLPALSFIGASNKLPEDEALRALFDRFLLRAMCDNVTTTKLGAVLEAGWKLEGAASQTSGALTADDVRMLQSHLAEVDLDAVRPAFINLITGLRNAGIPISDRRAVKLQRVIAAGALLCGRAQATVSDLWVVRHIWDSEEQRAVLRAMVDSELNKEEPHDLDHPQARRAEQPDPELLAADLNSCAEQLETPDLSAAERARLRDRISVLSGQLQWIDNDEQRAALQQRADKVWQQLEADAR